MGFCEITPPPVKARDPSKPNVVSYVVTRGESESRLHGSCPAPHTRGAGWTRARQDTARVTSLYSTGACAHHTSKETLKLIMIHVPVRLRVPCLVPRASVLDASLASGLGCSWLVVRCASWFWAGFACTSLVVAHVVVRISHGSVRYPPHRVPHRALSRGSAQSVISPPVMGCL